LELHDHASGEIGRAGTVLTSWKDVGRLQCYQ
jgi:hypothetical protein